MSEPRVEIVRAGKWLHWGSPEGFEWKRIELPIEGLSPKLVGLRVVHLTDLHLRSRWWAAYDDLLERLAKDPPDLILCTGDFVEFKWRRHTAVPVLRRLIDGMSSRLGVWGILGNHDGDLLVPHLVGMKLHLINRARTVIEANGDAIELIGLPGVNRLDLDEEFLNSIPERDPKRLRIVLQHYPDQVRRTEKLKPDLSLAGHTHGGQICLPGGFPMIKHDSLPREYVKGLHRWGSSWLHVGRGFGFSSIAVRTWCAPEVVEFVLVAR